MAGVLVSSVMLTLRYALWVIQSSNTVQVDAIQVRVYHYVGGGGAGGGGLFKVYMLTFTQAQLKRAVGGRKLL